MPVSLKAHSPSGSNVLCLNLETLHSQPFNSGCYCNYTKTLESQSCCSLDWRIKIRLVYKICLRVSAHGKVVHAGCKRDELNLLSVA
jgi:hypothetical protein